MEFTDQWQLPVEYRRATFGKRLLAWVIDIALVVVAGFLIGLTAYKTGLYDVTNISPAELAEVQEQYAALGIERSLATDILVILSAMALASTVVMLAISLLELFAGTSPGKMAVGLVIAHADGRPGDARLWTRRWLIKNAGSLLSAVALIPVLAFVSFIATIMGGVLFIGCFLALGQDRMAFHDRLSQSAVFPKENIQ